MPVYFYGQGQSLADIRGGRGRLDLGGPALHPTAGAVCVGARPKLVAFNVILSGIDAGAARALARSIRESGGGMRGVHALVFELSGGRVQLSMNLFRLEETTPAMVIAELDRRGVGDRLAAGGGPLSRGGGERCGGRTPAGGAACGSCGARGRGSVL